MIVRLQGNEAHPRLVPGAEYVVLAVTVSPDSPRGIDFMVHHPDKRGAWDWAWWDASLFEIVDGELPESWTLGFTPSSKGIDLMPAAWRRPWHWDDLDPSESDTRPRDVKQAARRRAWSDYRAERDRILAQAGRPPGHRHDPGPSCSHSRKRAT